MLEGAGHHRSLPEPEAPSWGRSGCGGRLGAGGALGGQNQVGCEERGHPKFHGFLWLCGAWPGRGGEGTPWRQESGPTSPICGTWRGWHGP